MFLFANVFVLLCFIYTSTGACCSQHGVLPYKHFRHTTHTVHFHLFLFPLPFNPSHSTSTFTPSFSSPLHISFILYHSIASIIPSNPLPSISTSAIAFSMAPARQSHKTKNYFLPALPKMSHPTSYLYSLSSPQSHSDFCRSYCYTPLNTHPRSFTYQSYFCILFLPTPPFVLRTLLSTLLPCLYVAANVLFRQHSHHPQKTLPTFSTFPPPFQLFPMPNSKLLLNLANRRRSAQTTSSVASRQSSNTPATDFSTFHCTPSSEQTCLRMNIPHLLLNSYKPSTRPLPTSSSSSTQSLIMVNPSRIPSMTSLRASWTKSLIK